MISMIHPTFSEGRPHNVLLCMFECLCNIKVPLAGATTGAIFWLKFHIELGKLLLLSSGLILETADLLQDMK